MPNDIQLEALKVPPHSLEAEQSVLGGLLLDNAAADKIGDILFAADFYSDAHRSVFEAIMDLIADNKPADVVTVAEALGSAQEARLRRRSRLPRRAGRERPDGGEYPSLRARSCATAPILRRLAAAGGEIAEAAYQPMGRSVREILDHAETSVFEIAEQGARGAAGLPGDLAAPDQVVERIELLYSARRIRPTSPACPPASPTSTA